jgi:hypothetical protein
MQQVSHLELTPLDLNSIRDEAKVKQLWEDRPAKEYRSSKYAGPLSNTDWSVVVDRLQLDVANKIVAGRLSRRSTLTRIAGGAIAGLLGAVGAIDGRRRHAAAQSATPAPGASAYSVIRRYQLRPEASMDDLVERVNEGFVPIVSKIPGLQEYLFVDAGEGAHLTISLYNDPSGAEQSTRNAASWATENVAALIEGPPEVATGWVRIHVDADDVAPATPEA